MLLANGIGTAQLPVTVWFLYCFFKQSEEVKLKNTIKGRTFVSWALYRDNFFTASFPWVALSMLLSIPVTNGAFKILEG